MKGILYITLATLAFASADAITKMTTEHNPVGVVVAVRYIVNVALLGAFLGPGLGAGLWRTERTGLVFVRSLCLAAASLTAGLALRLMPVGEMVAIAYLAPFLVMLLAIPLLGEKVGGPQWLGVAAGFFGVLLIVRPGGGLDPVGVALSLVNAGFSTAYHLLTRLLARSENTVALLFQTALVGAVLFSVLALGSLKDLHVTAVDIGLMVALGALMTAGHFLFTAAYREAPASLLAPVNYLHLFWAAGLGWLVFGHLPDSWSLVGIALICAAGALVAGWAYFAKAGR